MQSKDYLLCVIDLVLDFWVGWCGPVCALVPVKRRMLFGDGRRHDDCHDGFVVARSRHAVTILPGAHP